MVSRNQKKSDPQTVQLNMYLIAIWTIHQLLCDPVVCFSLRNGCKSSCHLTSRQEAGRIIFMFFLTAEHGEKELSHGERRRILKITIFNTMHSKSK